MQVGGCLWRARVGVGGHSLAQWLARAPPTPSSSPLAHPPSGTSSRPSGQVTALLFTTNETEIYARGGLVSPIWRRAGLCSPYAFYLYKYTSHCMLRTPSLMTPAPHAHKCASCVCGTWQCGPSPCMKVYTKPNHRSYSWQCGLAAWPAVWDDCHGQWRIASGGVLLLLLLFKGRGRASGGA